MSLTAARRARLLRWLYLLTPLLTASIVLVIYASGLGDFSERQMPASFGRYSSGVLHRAPIGWFLLTLGCAFGTVLDWARRDELQGKAFIRRVACFTPLLVVCHAVICAEFLGSWLVLLNFIVKAANA